MVMLLVKHIASGQAFFTGVGLFVLAVLLSKWGRRRWASVAWAVGLLLVAASAMPLPLTYYLVMGVVSLAWIVAIRRQTHPPNSEPAESENLTASPAPSRLARTLTGVFLGGWLIGAGLELPYHVTPTIPGASSPRLTILADSVTAGMGEHEAVTWPVLFASAHPIEVVDLSRMGATAASATRLAECHPPAEGIVLLEIGGNDILGSTTVGQFERTLDELLRTVSRPGRQVVMLELPLPPLFNEYGRVQRRLASRYDVTLIPKRFLLDVLLSESTTLDSIHLSQEGHQRMADRVWDLLRASFGDAGGE